MTSEPHKCTPHHPGVIDPAARDFYTHTLRVLTDAGVPFLLGGAYAFAQYTGIERHTKDLDVFVRSSDVQRTLDALEKAGYATDLTFPHWLAKAHCGADFIDVIFNSGNGVCPVDDVWFEHAPDADVFGVPVKLMPPEEMIWQKALILERERYDGADVAHIIRASAEHLNWERLVARFGPHYRVLLSHLILFGFIYPGERNRVPAHVLHDLLDRMRTEEDINPPDERICQGTIVSREQYLPDVNDWGYTDARVAGGYMSASEVHAWTDAINETS